MFTVLVAARGTGAVRIVDAARDSGLRPVTVYEPGDCRSLHADLAEEAYVLSRRVERDWPIDELVASARALNADIVHPGFTDAVRDAGLACAVEEAGLVWGGAPAAFLHELATPSPQAHGPVGKVDPSRRTAADRRVSAVVARERSREPVLLALTEQIGHPDAGVTRCPAVDLGQQVAQVAQALADALPARGFTHGLATLDLDVAGDGTLWLAGVRAGLQPDHAAVEEALDVDLAALELELAMSVRSPGLPGPPVRSARTRIIRPSGHVSRAARITELALPAGVGVRCDAGVRPGDPVPSHDEVLVVVTATGRDAAQADHRATRASSRLVIAGVAVHPDVTSEVLPGTGDAPSLPDPTAELLRSGAPEAVVRAALRDVAPGVRTILLEVDQRRVRVAVHPRDRTPRPRPPRHLRDGSRPEAPARA